MALLRAKHANYMPSNMVVPVKSLAEQMSAGVSYFEQFVWDLQQRGRADIDVPVLIIGIDE